MDAQKPSKMDTFFKYIKNIFLLLIVLQFAPIVFSGLKELAREAVSPSTHVGLITIKGILADASFYEKKIEQFTKDPEIKGLILKINSPGGYPGTAQEIFNEVKKFKAKKPVIVVVENLCASAAYYIAACGDYIICNPSSMVGSIGVLLELPNVKELLNSWKIKFNYVQSGIYKTAGSPLKDASPEEISYLQSISDDTYHQFISDVATSRKIAEKDCAVWANGKIFTGNQALKLKLVDKLGSFSDAVAEMKKRLKLDSETEIKLIQPKRTAGLLSLLKENDEYDMESSNSIADRLACFTSDVYHKFLFYQKNQGPNLQ